MDWNQKPHRFTFEIPEPVAPLIEARRTYLTYPSVSKYLTWTIVYDLFVRKPHRFSLWVMRQSERKQQDVLESLIEHFDSPKTPGGYFETRIREEAISMIESGEMDDLVLKRAAVLREREEQAAAQLRLEL